MTRHSRDGTESPGRIDLYKRGCFVLEAKHYPRASGDAVASGDEGAAYPGEDPGDEDAAGSAAESAESGGPRVSAETPAAPAGPAALFEV